MKKEVQTKIIIKLSNLGYTVKPIELTNNRFGVCIDNNYEGFYPGKIQFDNLALMRKMFSKNYTVEQRGHYSAIFIY